MNKLPQIAEELFRDKAAWTGGGVSIFANASQWWNGVWSLLPNTLEGWAALGVSAMTIIYLASKTYLVWKNQRDD